MNAALLDQVVIDVPRYTSYPTAAEFSSAVDAGAHASNLRAAATTASGPLSLYVHLPFCQSICHFCGCHALAARTGDRIDRYVQALRAEMALVGEAMGGLPRFGELHFGGGSPSLLEVPVFERLMADLKARFAFAPDAALSLEADPRTTDRAKLESYRQQGISRLSFGFQDLDENVQRAIGRNQSAAVACTAYDLARSVGFQGINIDLCYGLPAQTAETFARTVNETIALRPDRIALFGYAHVPWLRPRQKLIDRSALPAVDLRMRLMVDAHDKLVAAGYEAIGIDHFALPADSLAQAARQRRLHRNFQGYTATRTDAVVGLGLSAISELPAAYAQNARSLRDYYGAIDAGRLPTERGANRWFDDHLRGDIIRQIMCNFRIDRRKVEHGFGIDFASTFSAERAALEDLAAKGLVSTDNGDVELTPLGRLFARNVAAVFDAYRPPPAAAASAATERRFSPSI